MKSKNIKVWLAVNKNGTIVLFTKEPKRNTAIGKWESDYVFCNSVVYNDFEDLVKKVGITWESEPNMFELNYSEE